MTTDIKLFLDAKKEQDNLTLEIDQDINAFYTISGHMSEDGFVFTFEDDVKHSAFTSQRHNVVGSLDKMDLDYMLIFHITLITDQQLLSFEFNSNKLNNVNKISDGYYEIPLENATRYPHSAITEILFENVYEMHFDNAHYKVPLPLKQIINFMFSEQQKALYDTILVNPKYDDFMDEVALFREKHNIEFANSEGTERLVSLIYIVRKYLGTDWGAVYELLLE